MLFIYLFPKGERRTGRHRGAVTDSSFLNKPWSHKMKKKKKKAERKRCHKPMENKLLLTVSCPPWLEITALEDPVQRSAEGLARSGRLCT